VVDKPESWTSHDVVNKIRRLANTRKVGHLGTLDPIATGVLPLLAGRATRLAQFYTRNDKLYEGIIRFGYSTSTYDRAGAPTSPATEPILSRAEIEKHLEPFRGEIQQIPPPVSAKKVGGVPAYRLARKNMEVELAPVTVTVYEIALLDVTGSDARVRVHCSAGTYLRAIAHELGQALGCGAHLRDLRRLASGGFTIDQARTVPALEELASVGRFDEAVIQAADLLPEMPSVVVDQITASQIRNGRAFQLSPFRANQGTRYVKAVLAGGKLLAIGEIRLPNLYHPVVVM
jgi:tRNA pseudouridine55 synthase